MTESTAAASPPPPPPTTQQLPRGAPGVITASMIALVIAGLYFGRELLVPLALAALLAFLLDPLVCWLRRRRLPRGLAVALVITATVGVLGATALLIGTQVVALSKDLPTYETTIHKKLLALRKTITGRGVLDDASRVMGVVGDEIDATRRALDRPDAAAARTPMRVQVEPNKTPPVRAIGDLVKPVLVPLGMTGLVLVFLVFILLERHELRDRILRLFGGDIHRTTDALNEAANRVSRYLGMQLLVNLGYGLPMALGLWLIGIPGALLWGLLASALRFVPYVGPVIAAMFPLTLAFAVDPGWHMLLGALLLIASLELVLNNVIEPWLYGLSTGISPVSVLMSAAFWAVVWGPAGLILATPLTVCLVVLGRHLAPLRFLDVLLGSDPVFDLPTRLYQRLIAGNVEDASELALQQVAASSLGDFYSDTAMPMLRIAAGQPELVASAVHRHRLVSGLTALLQDLEEEHASTLPEHTAPSVLCIGGRTELDTLAARMLAHALADQGHAVQALSASAVAAERIASLDLDGIDTVCLSYFGEAPQVAARYVSRRLRRRRPGLRIVMALWDATPATLTALADAASDGQEVATHVREVVRRLARPEAPPAPGADECARLDALQRCGLLEADNEPLLEAAAQRTADVFRAACAMVTAVDGNDRVWLTVAGPARAVVRDARRAGRDGSPCWSVVAAGKARALADIGRELDCSADAGLAAAGLRAYAGAPLCASDGAVVGALCVYATDERRFSRRELALLTAMAQELMQQLAPAAPAARRQAGECGATAALEAPVGDSASPPAAAVV